MAINSFEDFIGQVAAAADQLKDAKENLDGVLATHTSKGFSTLTAPQFDGVSVDKTEYDNLMSSVSDLISVWWAAGHGTNIENFLVSTPE